MRFDCPYRLFVRVDLIDFFWLEPLAIKRMILGRLCSAIDALLVVTLSERRKVSVDGPKGEIPGRESDSFLFPC